MTTLLEQLILEEGTRYVPAGYEDALYVEDSIISVSYVPCGSDFELMTNVKLHPIASPVLMWGCLVTGGAA
jgi:hypothetical protein